MCVPLKEGRISSLHSDIYVGVVDESGRGSGTVPIDFVIVVSEVI